MNNITLEKANRKKLNKILEICELDEFISNLDDGINTIIGENGITLSGGQRQRIGLARSLYKDAQIYIFDEATNAIDKDTEKKILFKKYNYLSNKTVINISHNQNLEFYSDNIIHIDKIKF